MIEYYVVVTKSHDQRELIIPIRCIKTHVIKSNAIRTYLLGPINPVIQNNSIRGGHILWSRILVTYGHLLIGFRVLFVSKHFVACLWLAMANISFNIT